MKSSDCNYSIGNGSIVAWNNNDNEDGLHVFNFISFKPSKLLNYLQSITNYWKKEFVEYRKLDQSVVSFDYYDSDGDLINVSTQKTYHIFLNYVQKKFSESEDSTEIWLNWEKCSPQEKAADGSLDVNEILSEYTLNCKDSALNLKIDKIESIVGKDRDIFVPLTNLITKERENLLNSFNNRRITIEPDISLVLDTNVFLRPECYSDINNCLNNNRIRIDIPYIVAYELNQFKNNRKTSLEGDILRDNGKRAIDLFNDPAMKEKIFIGKIDEVDKSDIGTKPDKDDYIMFAVKHLEGQKTNRTIIVLSHDSGVELRIKSQCSSLIFNNFKQLNRFLYENPYKAIKISGNNNETKIPKIIEKKIEIRPVQESLKKIDSNIILFIDKSVSEIDGVDKKLEKLILDNTVHIAVPYVVLSQFDKDKDIKKTSLDADMKRHAARNMFALLNRYVSSSKVTICDYENQLSPLYNGYEPSRAFPDETIKSQVKWFAENYPSKQILFYTKDEYLSKTLGYLELKTLKIITSLEDVKSLTIEAKPVEKPVEIIDYAKRVVTPMDLILDTSVFTFNMLDKIESFFKNPNIKVRIPEFVANDIRSFKNNTKKGFSAISEKNAGERGQKLIDSYLNKSLILDTASETIPCDGSEIGEKDRVFLASMKWYSENLSRKIVIVTSTERVNNYGGMFTNVTFVNSLDKIQSL